MERTRAAALACVLAWSGCAVEMAAPDGDGGAGPSDAQIAPSPDAGGPVDPCGAAAECRPIDAVPFVTEGDTAARGGSRWDSYGCAPAVREAGPEHVYAIRVREVGVLGAAVEDGDAVDVDVHLLSALDPGACFARHDRAASRLVEPGTYYVVVDTWASAGGAAHPGPYVLRVQFLPVPEIDCGTVALDLQMYWDRCAPGIACEARTGPQGELQFYLRTPAVGPVVREAHLVVEDDAVSGWPASSRDGLDDHYLRSEAASRFVMPRREDWAPAGEGGSRWGQGAIGRRLPGLDEAWYVNMYWRMRPAPGTRMLVRDPRSGRAVVAAAGYETGPGDPSRIGGAAEEIHHYLGSEHLDVLEMGFLADPSAPLGPVRCRR